MIYFVEGHADMLCKIERAVTEGCLAAQAVCEQRYELMSQFYLYIYMYQLSYKARCLK